MSDEVARGRTAERGRDSFSGTWEESLFMWILAIILFLLFSCPKREARTSIGLSVFGRSIGKAGICHVVFKFALELGAVMFTYAGSPNFSGSRSEKIT